MHIATAFRFAGYLLLGSATVYSFLTLLALRWRYSRVARQEAETGVSVMKPLCGAEPRLYENLRSFCEQAHPNYQIVFGAREADDPALNVARQLQAEFAQLDIAVVVDSRVHGRNLKVSNLINLLPHARHDWLVIADSDIAVRPNYLSEVTAPLADPRVGLVTCLYRGRALGGLWSRLGMRFIDDWFLPSVALSQMFGADRFGFGATIAMRRDALQAIGGLESVSGLVADDYWLGERIANTGLRTVLSDHDVVTDVTEGSLAELASRELRWFRTIRSVRPMSYFGTGICFTLPVVAIGLALTGSGTAATGLATLALAARIMVFFEGQTRSAEMRDWPRDLLAFLLRDSLSLLLWAWAFSSANVRWRGQQLSIETRGGMQSS